MNENEAEELLQLPKLTAKQEAFVNRYFENGKNGIEAYIFAYDADSMNRRSIYKEVYKLLKHPKITPHLNFRQKQINAAISEKINYGVIEAFNALLTAQQMAFDEKKHIRTSYSVKEIAAPNVAAFIKAEELKCKLLGLMSDKEVVQPVASQFNIVVNDNEKDL